MSSSLAMIWGDKLMASAPLSIVASIPNHDCISVATSSPIARRWGCSSLVQVSLSSSFPLMPSSFPCACRSIQLDPRCHTTSSYQIVQPVVPHSRSECVSCRWSALRDRPNHSSHTGEDGYWVCCLRIEDI